MIERLLRINEIEKWITERLSLPSSFPLDERRRTLAKRMIKEGKCEAIPWTEENIEEFFSPREGNPSHFQWMDEDKKVIYKFSSGDRWVEELENMEKKDFHENPKIFPRGDEILSLAQQFLEKNKNKGLVSPILGARDLFWITLKFFQAQKGVMSQEDNQGSLSWISGHEKIGRLMYRCLVPWEKVDHPFLWKIMEQELTSSSIKEILLSPQKAKDSFHLYRKSPLLRKYLEDSAIPPSLWDIVIRESFLFHFSSDFNLESASTELFSVDKMSGVLAWIWENHLSRHLKKDGPPPSPEEIALALRQGPINSYMREIFREIAEPWIRLLEKNKIVQAMEKKVYWEEGKPKKNAPVAMIFPRSFSHTIWEGNLGSPSLKKNKEEDFSEWMFEDVELIKESHYQSLSLKNVYTRKNLSNDTPREVSLDLYEAFLTDTRDLLLDPLSAKGKKILSLWAIENKDLDVSDLDFSSSAMKEPLPKNSFKRLWSLGLFAYRQIRKYNKVYIQHFIDSRGRIYPLENPLNYQGWFMQRYILSFKERKSLEEWEKSHGISAQEDWSSVFQRMANLQIPDIWEKIKDFSGENLSSFWEYTLAHGEKEVSQMSAKKTYVLGLLMGEYLRWKKQKTSFRGGSVAISWDAKSSGYQIQALAQNSSSLREAVGLGTKNMDIYTSVTEEAQKILRELRKFYFPLCEKIQKSEKGSILDSLKPLLMGFERKKLRGLGELLSRNFGSHIPKDWPRIPPFSEEWVIKNRYTSTVLDSWWVYLNVFCQAQIWLTRLPWVNDLSLENILGQRKFAKPPVMTFLYGARPWSKTKKILDLLEKWVGEKNPENFSLWSFLEKNMLAQFLEKFYRLALKRAHPESAELMDLCREVSQVKSILRIDSSLFSWLCHPLERETKIIRLSGKRVTLRYNLAEISPTKISSSLAANITQMGDAWVAHTIISLRKERINNFPIFLVHDGIYFPLPLNQRIKDIFGDAYDLYEKEATLENFFQKYLGRGFSGREKKILGPIRRDFFLS